MKKTAKDSGLHNTIKTISVFMLGAQLGFPNGDIKKANESVVEVKTFDKYPSGGFTLSTSASGFFVSDQGHICTCYHLVKGGKDDLFVIHNGIQHKAELHNFDENTNIAILKIDNVKSNKISIGEDPKIIENVYAVGNVFGEGQIITKGIVSGVTFRSRTYIALATETNMQNNGGILFNESGQAVGILGHINRNDDTFSGIGCAMPIKTAEKLL